MYDGGVACCPLVSQVEYAPRTLLRLEKRWDRQTDERGQRNITLHGTMNFEDAETPVAKRYESVESNTPP